MVRVLSVVFSTIPKMFVSFVISTFLLQATFEVDPKNKKKIQSDASRYWRNFKTNLTGDLVMKCKDDFPNLLKHPPQSYVEYIDQTVWDKFVVKRLTLEWEALRKFQQERRAKNTNLHKFSRMGYVDLVEKLEKELGRKLTDLEEVICGQELEWMRKDST